MKKGITPIIAIVLLLMMTVAAFGLTFVWVQSTQGDIQESISGDIQDIQAKVSSCMSIDAINFNKVYLRNCGEGALANSTLKIYVNGIPANYTLNGDIKEGKSKEVEIAYPNIQTTNSLSFQSASGKISKTTYKRDIKKDIDSDSSLVGYWAFDEGSGTIAKDSSEKKNDGILFGDTSSVSGKLGNAFEFDGVGDYIDVGDDMSLTFTNEFTVALWAKRTGAESRLIGDYRNDLAGGWRIQMAVPQLGFVISDGVSDHSIVGDTSISSNEWYFIAGTYDKAHGILRVYLNGLKDKEDNSFTQGVLTSSTSNITIGRFSAFGTGYFNGIIDEVRVFNRALSEEEVKTLYEMDA